MTTTVVATLTSKFSASQPSSATVGTTVVLNGPYQARFSQQQPSSGNIGTISSASMVVTSLPQSGASQMLMGTTATSSSIVYGMFAAAKPAEMQIGTVITLNATHTSLFENNSPPIFNRKMLNDGKLVYSDTSSTLFMSKNLAGDPNNKARFLIDLGELKRIDTMQINSGESNSNGNQKIKRVVIYTASQQHTKADLQLNNLSVVPGVQVGSMEWSSTSATQNETTIRKST